MEKKNYFSMVVAATGRNYYIEKSISGYYRLMLDDEPIIDDCACEDLNEDYETAESYFINYLMEYAVPENRKELRCGLWILKNN